MASWIKEEEKNREDQTHNTFNKELRTSDAGILHTGYGRHDGKNV